MAAIASSDGRRFSAVCGDGVDGPLAPPIELQMPSGSVIGSKCRPPATGISHNDSPDNLFQKYGRFSRFDQNLRQPMCTSSGDNSSLMPYIGVALPGGPCGVCAISGGVDLVGVDGGMPSIDSPGVGNVDDIGEQITVLLLGAANWSQADGPASTPVLLLPTSFIIANHVWSYTH